MKKKNIFSKLLKSAAAFSAAVFMTVNLSLAAAADEGTDTAIENNADLIVKNNISGSSSSAAEVKGDANGDGKLDVRDAAFIAGEIAKGRGKELALRGDINLDGKVDIRDAAAIVNHLAFPHRSYSDSKISYLGPEGTYTQEACETYFDKQGAYEPYKTVKDAVEALMNNSSDYAVIPQENTIGGAVTDYVDTLIALSGVSVAGEVELPINQNLLTMPDASLDDIKVVYSHKQGIAQGREWLEKNLPDAQVIEVSSTAEGAKMVSQQKDKSCAAIASAGCADVYGLKIMAANIQNNDNNNTRFYVLSKDKPGTAANDRFAFVAKGDASQLPKLMSQMEKQGTKLVTLHDRPLKTILGQYYYLIECAHGGYSDFQKLKDSCGFDFTYLGSFDVK